jgi:DNA modification methylase
VIRREVTIGDCRLILGDCVEVLPTLAKVDAIVTDPPYGINAARDRNSEKWGWRDFPITGWNKVRPTPEAFQAILKAAKHHIIWGGNYFSDMLPASDKWLVWDKCQSEFSLADVELAWCSFSGAARRINYSRSQALQDGKVHHTQKALQVMAWSLSQLPKGVATVCDPYTGSGTTGAACIKAGLSFIGIEVNEHYFDITCERLRKAYAQPDMFIEPRAPEPVQEALSL